MFYYSIENLITTFASTCCLVSIAGILFWVLTKNYFFINGYWEKRGIPAYYSPSIVKSILSLFLQTDSICNKVQFLYEKFQTPYVGVMMLNKPVLLVKSPQLLKSILIRDNDKFANRYPDMEMPHDQYMNHSMYFVGYDTWKYMRSKISPAFSSGKLKFMFPLQQECVQTFLEHLLGSFDEQDIDVKEKSKRLSVDMICSCAFGIKTNVQTCEDSEVFHMTTKLMDWRPLKRKLSVITVLLLPTLAKMFKLSFADMTAMEYFADIFKNSFSQRKKQNIRREDFIDLLHQLFDTENGGQVDENKLAAQALTIFFAGYESTTLNLSFMLHEVALDKEIQERAREEVCRIHEKYEGQFPYEALQEMEYTEMILKECLRKYPLGPFLTRYSTQDYTFEETGKTIEKDTTILIPNTAISFDPAFFPEPNKFNPERFSKKNISKITPLTFFPFSEGPKSCLGQRFAMNVLKLAFASVIRIFEVEPCEKTQKSLQMRENTYILDPKDGVWLKIKKIQQKQ